MPIIWDSNLTAAVARELRDHLAGARLEGHTFDWDHRELLLHFRSGTLRWSLHPQAGWVTLADPGERAPGFRPLSAQLLEVRTPPDERHMVFRFRKLRGQVRAVEVVVELMTNQWNGLLLEGPDRWIRHVLWTRRMEGRVLEPGQAYQPPEPSQRVGTGPPPSDRELTELLTPGPGQNFPGNILDRVAYTSTLNLGAILRTHASGESQETAGKPDLTLWSELRSGEASEPCLLQTERGPQPYPVALPTYSSTPYPSLLQAMEACSEAASESSDSLTDRLDRALHRARGRLNGLGREMDQAGDPGQTRELANLLLARLGQVRRGTSVVHLKGFKGEEVKLDLDPALSPHENAQALYEEAARQERVMERLPPLIDEAREKLAELEALGERIRRGEADEETVDALLPKPRTGNRWQSRDKNTRIPYRSFMSSGGLEVRVGKGPTDNDALTFHHSHPDDIWLHARDTSGAHVILKWARKDPPPSRDLTEAAVLAALHSGARGSGVVPVDWTWRRYVRKPRKSPPGLVRLDRAETLFVRPDPDLPQRLSPKGGG
jgi:predicted ribosome quality control (RQC) complex YloA/Tae2 family protein